MAHQDWQYTRRAIEACEPPTDEDDEPERGHRLLRALAEESGGLLVEVEPGRWFESKLSPPTPSPAAICFPRSEPSS